jgi:hypothetical protein
MGTDPKRGGTIMSEQENQPILPGFDEDGDTIPLDPNDAPQKNPENEGTTDDPAQVAKPGDTAPKQDKPKTFTQEELDAIIEKRLSREKATFEKQLKANPVLSQVQKIAAKSGMTEDQLLAAWAQQEVEQRAEEDGMSVEAAAKAIAAEKRAEAAEAKLREKTEAEQKIVAEQKEFADFVAEYKDVDAQKIPAEVWEMREKTGKSLSDCYERYEARQLRTKLAAAETLLKNIRKAPVSGGAGGNGTKTPVSSDPFLEGFDSA